VVELTRATIPHLIERKGTIVNVSSICGNCSVLFCKFNLKQIKKNLHQFPAVTYYCMSKAALDQFTKCLALELAPKGVRVNAVKYIVKIE
jgi:NAD(P)-dependent dehydrogenase (short-subunit alcohol dehydrogenase family)